MNQSKEATLVDCYISLFLLNISISWNQRYILEQ